MSAMSLCGFPEPPTRASLEDARRVLDEQRNTAATVAARILAAEEELTRIVQARRDVIQEMEKERAAVEDQVSRTLAYLSHIRRLPHELLGQIFMFIFEEYPCCSWVLAAVCSMWRRQVPSTPRLWSKIRLVTTPNSSPDTVRLWLERSGRSVPLDIEIFLRTQSHLRETPIIRRRSSSVTLSPGSGWDWIDSDLSDTTPGPPGTPGLGGGPAFIHIPAHGPPHFLPITTIPNSPPIHHHHVHAGPAPIYHEALPVSSWHHVCQHSRNATTTHWGYIAFFYLMQQMHRWERFVFRFDRHFSSINALKVMSGDAPLLREFEVSSGESALAGSINDWTWLLCAKSMAKPSKLPQLTSLTLQYVPFKWSSPIFSDLRYLCLRTIPQYSIAIDRILYIINANTRLETLVLYIAAANTAVLPLSQTTLEHVTTFSIGGHFLLTTLLDCLSLPAVENLMIDIEAREPVEEILSQLLVRSNHPPVSRLSLSYMLHGSSSTLYYHTGSGVTSWNFLSDMDDLHTLQVGGAPFEPLLAILGTPEDDGLDQWFCPKLVALSMKGCRPTHSDCVGKLVQMVEARNPDLASGGVPMIAAGVTPTRLRHLELHDCTTLGLDVMQWLLKRIPEVVCTEPPFDSAGLRSPSYQYL